MVTRIIVRDDAAQLTAIEQLLNEPLFVTSTVVLETVWVLSSRYRMQRATIADALSALIDIPNVQIEAPELVLWVLERFRGGADFADMLHLVAGRGGEAFVTFDRGVAKAAQPGPPIPVVTLRG